jgi:hypothetical protein
MELQAQQSRQGNWWHGPWPKQDSEYRWIGPYSTKKDAEQDLRGIARFHKRENKQ